MYRSSKGSKEVRQEGWTCGMIFERKFERKYERKDGSTRGSTEV